MSITAAFYNYFTTYFYKQCRFPPLNETLNGPRNQNTERENEAVSVIVKAYGSSIFVFSNKNQTLHFSVKQGCAAKLFFEINVMQRYYIDP